MRDDHYSTDDHDEDRESDDSSEMEQESALVPRGLFPKPPKPGKKCTFEVVAVRGDEVEIKYSKSKEDKDDDDKEDDKDDDDTVSVASKDYDDPFTRYDTEA